MSKTWLLLPLVAWLACCGRSGDRVMPEARLSAAPAPAPFESEDARELWAADEPEPQPTAPEAQRRRYLDPGPKSVIDLQQYRKAASILIEDAAGLQGTATLTDLAPAIGEWFLLELAWRDGRSGTYHLENPHPRGQRLSLDPTYLYGLVLETPAGREPCDLWSRTGALERVAGVDQPYVQLCGSRLYWRRAAVGRKTGLERTTDFLRDRIVGGERITVFVRDNFFKDAHLSTSELLAPAPGVEPRPRLASAPASPALDPEYQGLFVAPSDLGLLLDTLNPGRIQVGRWTTVRGIPGVFVSAIQPGLVSRELRRTWGGRLNPLDEVELSALVYMVAFDLDEFDLDFALGTDHPRLGWSDRVPDAVRVTSLAGPDGFGDAAPLVRTGMVSPEAATRIAATFTGGFKRSHGAFKYSELALRDRGTHYGLVERGTVLSKLHAGLATVVVYGDGTVALKTWTSADDADLWRLRHARQNGLPLVETDPETGSPRPGSMVPNWAQGNWSGSQEKRLRSLRAGLCLQESDAGRFLIYGYFSSATPSAMAIVFAAYGCDYALLLDMNALEHTYLALYRVKNGEFLTQHLIGEMRVLDQIDGNQELPRFVGFADNRDFFYLSRRREP